MSEIRTARASAPASIGNVGVGFDVLGLAFDACRDSVTAYQLDEPGRVELGDVAGLVDSLPAAVPDNCALAAADAVLKAANADFGVRLDVTKGVPMSAGMGGSAASAVAAAGAVNALLDQPFTLHALLPLAMEGEKVSADPPPWDNVMSSLLGGLVLAARLDPPLIRRLPLPNGITCKIWHPDRKIETQAAREMLSDTVPMATAVQHSRNMASFLVGCEVNDETLISTGLTDILVEPQRLPLMPELQAIKDAAIGAGALGCSFSGSGPSIFAFMPEHLQENVAAAVRTAFENAGMKADAYRAPLNSQGMRLELRP